MNTVHAFTITVDGEPLEITEHELTPADIMTRAGIDPATNYLLEIRGHERVSLEGKNDVPIHIHEKLQLVSVNTGPKPVS
ncbi:MAG: hypothetical protein H0U52_17245 [Chloroflexi bacterium]|nr:hypothetical protein [Chloroflexota bacterium]